VLASAGEDRLVRLWDTATGKLRGTLGGPVPCRALAFTADGKHLLQGLQNGLLALEAVPPETGLQTVATGDDPITALTGSPHGKRAAVGVESGFVSVHELPSLKRVLQHRQHFDRVTALAFSGDGRKFASAGADLVVRAAEIEPLRSTSYSVHSGD